MIPLTPEQIEKAIEGLTKGVIKGGAEVAKDMAKVAKVIIDIFKDKKMREDASKKLHEMLRNPRIAWRKTKTLAREIIDEPAPYHFTRALLREIGARLDRTQDEDQSRYEKGEDLWIYPGNWEWREPTGGELTERVRMNPDDTYVLKQGIKPSNA
jgi:hypothetical protein